MNARTFRKPANRELRVARLATAREAIGEIRKGQDCFILTFGQFSLIDALVAILDQVGPARVDISTWTAADAHLERSAELMADARITQFRMVVDRSFEGRKPDFAEHMRRLFGAVCIRAIRTHAKFLVIRSATHDLVVRTSMNLNENPRLENLEISESREFAEFFEQVVDGIFAEVAAGENRSALVALRGVPDDFPFQEVQAEPIRREDVGEASAEYTLKKL